MKKIPNVFVRDWNGDKSRVLRDVEPASAWVVAGEGIATRKWDGTACLIENGVLFKRYDAKGGKTPPAGFLPAQDPDPVTGHWPGWLEVSESKPEDKWILAARMDDPVLADGTYEACGPKIGGNPEGLERHQMFRHGAMVVDVPDRSYDGIKAVLTSLVAEGLVFHHSDGRMAKVKRHDFGLPWGANGASKVRS